MSNSSKAFQQHKIQSTQPLTAQKSERLDLLTHLEKLVKDNPQEAREALQMSQEQAPELFLIAQNQPSTQWAASLMSSESMLSLMSQNPRMAKKMLDKSDLRSLLEMLP
jgi:hypothetical protein